MSGYIPRTVTESNSLHDFVGLDQHCLSVMSLCCGLKGRVMFVPPTVLEAQTCVPRDWTMQSPTSQPPCCPQGAQTLHLVFLGSQTPIRPPGWSPFLPDANAGARLPGTPSQELCSPPSWCSTHRCPSHSLSVITQTTTFPSPYSLATIQSSQLTAPVRHPHTSPTTRHPQQMTHSSRV